MNELSGARILITGPTSQVGKPVAIALAEKNTVFGMARFSDVRAKVDLEAGGVRCISADLGTGDFSTVPRDVDYVLNFAVAKTLSWDADIAANVEGLGLLMSHLRAAKALLHCSSIAVYEPNGHHCFAETDALGDNNRVPAMEMFMPTYSINKIAAEAMARYVAREHDLPTIIARLSVPYGDNGGWPVLHLGQVLVGDAIAVHSNAPSLFNLIHEDDVIGSIPRLLAGATVPATIVNWGGADAVSIEEWSTYLAGLVGREAKFVSSDAVVQSGALDLTKQHELIGTTSVHWRDGLRRMVQTFHPEIELSAERVDEGQPSGS